MTISIKLRRKYTEAKIGGDGSSKPSANQKRALSLRAALHESWVRHEPGRTIHAEDVKRQKGLAKRIRVVPVNGKAYDRWEEKGGN